MAFCTYLYQDPKAQVWRYVGKGVDERRARSHLTKSTNPQLHNTIQKRLREGYEVKPLIIPAESSDDAKEMEALLIQLIGREDLGLGTLFNKTDGGEGNVGGIVSESTREKRRQKLLSKTEAERMTTRAKADQTRKSKSKEEQDASWARRSEAKKKMHSELPHEVKEQMRLKLIVSTHKPCTIDFITFYPNRLSLVKALGQSRAGSRSPDFHYLTPEEKIKYGF